MSETETEARDRLKDSLSDATDETPLLDAVDGVAEWSDLRPVDVLERLEATEGRVALYIYGSTDCEFWLRYRRDCDEWEGISRYPTGAWEGTTAGQGFAAAWLEGWFQHVHRGEIRLPSEFHLFERIEDDDEVPA